MNYIRLFSLVALGLSIQAMESNNNNQIPGRHYQGKEINPETMEFLGPQEGKDEAAADLKQWASQHPDVLAKLADFEAINWKENFIAARKLLAAHDIQVLNPQGNSFVFPISKKNLVELSGPAHKVYNIASDADICWNDCDAFMKGKQPLTQEQLSKFKESAQKGITYQGVSRFANYLLILQAIADLKAQGKSPLVSVTPTYLLPIPGVSNHEPASDKTHVVVQNICDKQQFAPVYNSYPVLQELCVENLNDEAIRQWVKIILDTKIYDGSKILLDRLGRIHTASMQQPNDSAPKYFLNKRPAKFPNDVREGIKKLYRLLGNSRKADVIKEWIAGDEGAKDIKRQLGESGYYPVTTAVQS